MAYEYPGEPPLRPFQVEGVDWLIKNRRCVLGDDKGIGKTVQVIKAMIEVKPKRVLIIVPGIAGLYVWLKEQLPKWNAIERLGLGQPVLMTGSAAKRAKLWKTSHFVITTYAGFREDMKHNRVPLNWDVVTCDEYHRAFKRRRTKTHEYLKQLQSTYFWPFSGSAASKGPHDIWAPINLCQPRIWTSYWKFVDNYCIVSINQWGGREIIGEKNVEELWVNLQHVFKRRLKREVLPQLPPKIRQPAYVDMTDRQAYLYAAMAKDMIVTLDEAEEDEGDKHILASTALTKIVRLRQILVCPKIIDPNCPDYGGAIEYVLDDLEGAESEKDRHCVVFTPFRDAVSLIRQALEEKGFGPVIELMGGQGHSSKGIDELKRKIDLFRAQKGIAVCTIQFAESFELDPADKGYFVGFEYDAEQNSQAEDRLHRGTVEWPVNFWYILHNDTVDEDVMDVLDRGTHATHTLMHNPEKLKMMLNKYLRLHPKMQP